MVIAAHSHQDASMSLPPAESRFLEDYLVGSLHEFGDALVDEAEVIAFARAYDPQYFHTDPQAAKAGPFGGLIASGWHTCGLFMRMLVDHFVPGSASLGSPGVDAIRWPHPVRPGDRLSAKVLVIEARRSQSKPDRGVVECHGELVNQDGVTVLTIKNVMLIKARGPA